MGLFQEVYRYDEARKKTHVNTRLKAELKSFARTWFRNLREQGFFGPQLSGSGSHEPLFPARP